MGMSSIQKGWWFWACVLFNSGMIPNEEHGWSQNHQPRIVLICIALFTTSKHVKLRRMYWQYHNDIMARLVTAAFVSQCSHATYMNHVIYYCTMVTQWWFITPWYGNRSWKPSRFPFSLTGAACDTRKSGFIHQSVQKKYEGWVEPR